MVTNDELQDELQKFADGEPISLELARHFYNQNDGYMVVGNERESAMGFVPKRDKLLIDVIEVGEDEEATLDEERSFAVPASTKTAQQLISEVRVGTKDKFQLNVGQDKWEMEDPENHEDMYT